MRELTRVQGTQFPRPDACAECHVEIYREWEQSPHAAAFTSEQYRRATDDYRFAKCVGCHAPQPMLALGEPKPRETERQAGVACVACHLDEGAMVGPLQPTGMVKPHPIRVDPILFADGNLCGRCHPSTLEQWSAAQVPNKADCRECHMPAVQRKITQATSLISRPLVAVEKPAVEHRHVFSLSPESLTEGPCRLDVTRTGSGAARLTIVNLLPHDLPTGDFGVRTIQVRAEVVERRGTTRELGAWELTRAAGAALAGGASRSWDLALGPDDQVLRVLVARQGREAQDHVVLVRKEVALP
jgi:hypothetical protein